MNAPLNATAGLSSANGTVKGLFAGAANAAGNATAATPLGAPDGLFSWGGYFQALGVLFLIIAVLWAALWYLRRKGGFKILTMQGDLVLESRMALGPKKSLIVVRFLNKRVLLGVTDQQITMLTELPRDDEPDDAFEKHLDEASANQRDSAA